MFFNYERLLHSVKTLIACMIGFGIAAYLEHPSDQWIVITIVIVMCAQIHVGGVIKKSYLRFLGTTLGCVFALLAFMISGYSLLTALITICGSAFIFSYISTGKEDFSYAGTLGAATTAIIMLSPNPSISLAFQRFFEISGGILIASLVSQFILPIHAGAHLRREQAKTLSQLKEYYFSAMQISKRNFESTYFQELDDNIVKSISKQRQLANEAAAEKFGVKFDPKHFMQSLNCEKEILRAIYIMRDTIEEMHRSNSLLFLSPLLTDFNEKILEAFDVLVARINKGDKYQHELHIPTLNELKEEIETTGKTYSSHEKLATDTFIYSTEILLKQLIKLAHLYSLLKYDLKANNI